MTMPKDTTNHFSWKNALNDLQQTSLDGVAELLSAFVVAEREAADAVATCKAELSRRHALGEVTDTFQYRGVQFELRKKTTWQYSDEHKAKVKHQVRKLNELEQQEGDAKQTTKATWYVTHKSNRAPSE
jgi:hypothetical protein|tara:strand:- start:5 stop:391 length:387 start_codon:yes stop_codon:yes gene_type:complete